MGSCVSSSSTSSNSVADDFMLPPSITDNARLKEQLADILRHPQLSVLFQGYLKSIFCDESLAFFMDIEEYREIELVEKRKEKADKIFEKYFNPNSKSEIVCGADMMAKMKAGLPNASKDLFDRLQTQVFMTMVDDCLPNFLTWQLYFDFITDPITRRVFLCGIRRTNSVNQILTYTEKHKEKDPKPHEKSPTTEKKEQKI